MRHGATLAAIIAAHSDVGAWGIDLSPKMTRMPEGDVRVYTAAELTRLAEAVGYRVDVCIRAGVRGQLLVARR